MITHRYRMLAVAGLPAAMLLTASLANAQAGPGMGCAPGYYGTRAEAVHGVVAAVRNDTRFWNWGGTEVALKTEKGTVTVLLGPALFLSRSGFTVAEGDELSVTGFRLAPGQIPYLLAREVTLRDKTLTLQDARGIPAWAGAGMGWRLDSGGWGGPGYGRCRRWR